MLAKDPCCGMEIDANSASYKEQYQGKKYYFCSQACKDSFNSEPEKYVNTEENKH